MSETAIRFIKHAGCNGLLTGSSVHVFLYIESVSLRNPASFHAASHMGHLKKTIPPVGADLPG